MYYNTNRLIDKKLAAAIAKADKQEQKVKVIFNCYGKLTPSDVYSFFPSNVPITSIRRATTNLKNEGFLKITDEMKEGLFGSPEHYYQVHNQLTLF